MLTFAHDELKIGNELNKYLGIKTLNDLMYLNPKCVAVISNIKWLLLMERKLKAVRCLIQTGQVFSSEEKEDAELMVQAIFKLLDRIHLRVELLKERKLLLPKYTKYSGD